MARPLAGVVAALLVGLGAVGVAAGAARAQTVNVSRTPVTRPLSDEFLGLALEFNTIPRWVGPSGQPPDPVLVQLIRNLDPAGSPELRIGGQSTDRAWWPVPHMARPPGVTYDLGPSWTLAARRLATALDARYLLGINLEADSTRISHLEADELVHGVGRSHIAALDLGNEPDLYDSTPWYRVAAGGHPLPWYAHTGSPVLARPRGYSPGDFLAEVQRTLRVIPDLPLGGPDAANPTWIGSFARLLGHRSRVRMLDSHAYALINCVTDPASPAYPSVPHLLALPSARDLLAPGTAPLIAQAHRAGGQFRVDEMGSISCNGKAGVSNAMASALWVADSLFALDDAGVDGVDLHTYPGSVNGLFDLSEAHGRWTARIHPLYDGAVLFSQAAPAGSRLLPVAAGDQRDLRAWATLAPDHLVRVLLINVGAATTATVHAPVDYGSQAASVEWLRARSAYATAGVTLGGQRFGVTSTGALPTPRLPVARPHGGAFRIAMPAASAALLTLSPR